MLSMLSNRLLVAETDGLALRAAIVVARRGKVVVERMAVSAQADPNRALAEAIEQLRPHRLPLRAVLAMPEVAVSVVSLPVSPKQPRPAAQMQELIRWELEPQIALNAGARPLGQVLVGRGALTYEQVEQVLAEMEAQRQLAPMLPGQQRQQRFGEVAVGLGLVRREQVEEALAIQQRFQVPADDLICGWAPLSDDPADDGQFRWLVCGVSRELRSQCQRAFAAHGLSLQALYPHTAGSAPLIAARQATGTHVVLEIQHGVINVLRLVDGMLEGLQSHLTAGHRPTAELCHELVGSTRADEVWIAGNYEPWQTLAGELGTLCRREVLPVLAAGRAVLPEGQADNLALSTLAGVARHALKLGTSSSTVAVRGHDKRPTAWNEPRRLSAVAAAAVVLAAIGLDQYLQSSLRVARVAQGQATRALSEARSEVEEIKYLTTRVEQLQAELQKAEHEVEAARRATQLLDEAVPRRMRFLPALLDALVKVTTEEVAVERVTEQAGGRFEVTAWALNQQAATRFGQSVAESLVDWRITVTQGSLWEEEGRLGLPGYLVSLEIGPSANIQEPPAQLSSTPQEAR